MLLTTQILLYGTRYLSRSLLGPLNHVILMAGMIVHLPLLQDGQNFTFNQVSLKISRAVRQVIQAVSSSQVILTYGNLALSMHLVGTKVMELK